MNLPETSLEYCGFIRRIAIMVYDMVIVFGLLIIAAALVSPLDQGNQQALRDPVFSLYLILVWFLYLGFCWSRGGMTIGMRAWRVKIVTGAGDNPDWRTSGIRFITSMLSAVLLGAGFIAAWFDQHHRCWHDRASKTALIRFDPHSD